MYGNKYPSIAFVVSQHTVPSHETQTLCYCKTRLHPCLCNGKFNYDPKFGAIIYNFSAWTVINVRLLTKLTEYNHLLSGICIDPRVKVSVYYDVRESLNVFQHSLDHCIKIKYLFVSSAVLQLFFV